MTNVTIRLIEKKSEFTAILQSPERKTAAFRQYPQTQLVDSKNLG
jgi:hypothetical protein